MYLVEFFYMIGNLPKTKVILLNLGYAAVLFREIVFEITAVAKLLHSYTSMNALSVQSVQKR